MAMTVMIYGFCIVLAAIVTWILPQPWGLAAMMGLILGAIMQLSDRVSRIEDELGLKREPSDGVNDAVEAERKRIAKILAGDSKGQPKE